jgi:outer membrane protein
VTLAVLALVVQANVLALAEAERSALVHQPQLALARANTDAAWARVGQAQSVVLPQLSGIGSYQRTTANFVIRPGLLPSQINMQGSTAPTFSTFDFWNFSLQLNQFIWDFRTPFSWGATKASAQAQAAGEHNTRQQVISTVRVAFFNARAQKALAQVAHDNATNQARHLAQIRGFVNVGARSQIDLAQGETNYANAEVQSINADNNYEIAKVQLNQAMGLEGPPDYEVADEWLGPVEGEDRPIDVLFDEAKRTRPDIEGLEQQTRAQRALVGAAVGSWGPTFSASMTLNDAGTNISQLTWNWNVTVNASWVLFDGLLTYYRMREAQANLRGVRAQTTTLVEQALVEVSQARLQVRAAKATRVAAEKALASARLQLSLAEGRYREGVGSVIELGDAQVNDTTAAAQVVQADYTLSTARALLAKALGRDR